MKNRIAVFSNNSEFRRRRKRLAVILLWISILSTSAFALDRQPYAVRYQRFSYSCDIIISDKTHRNPKKIAWIARPVYRGIFAIGTYNLVRWNDSTRSYDSDFIPAGSTVVFFEKPDLRTVGFADDIAGYHPTDQAHFVGQISIRREILWTILGLASAALLWNIAALSRIQLRIQRFKRGLCARCAYPLPIEDEDPRCPECGTLHKQ